MTDRDDCPPEGLERPTFLWFVVNEPAQTRKHLNEWVRAGHAPFWWDDDTVDAFWVWVVQHADEYSANAGWPEMSRHYEAAA